MYVTLFNKCTLPADVKLVLISQEAVTWVVEHAEDDYDSGSSNNNNVNVEDIFVSSNNFLFHSVFFYRSSSALHCQSSSEWAPSVQGSAHCPFFHFWLQQDLNPRPGAFHADVLPLRHFDPHEEYFSAKIILEICEQALFDVVLMPHSTLIMAQT